MSMPIRMVMMGIGICRIWDKFRRWHMSRESRRESICTIGRVLSGWWVSRLTLLVLARAITFLIAFLFSFFLVRLALFLLSHCSRLSSCGVEAWWRWWRLHMHHRVRLSSGSHHPRRREHWVPSRWRREVRVMRQHHAWRGHARDVGVWIVRVAIADEVRVGWIRMPRTRRSQTRLWRNRSGSGLLCGWVLGDGGNSGSRAA